MPLTNVGDTYRKLLIPFSFILMLLVAYAVDRDSFLITWKGRAFYLFFLWLFILELILGNRNPESNRNVEWSRVAIGTFLLMIPTIYLIEAHVFNLNNTIIEFGESLGIPPGWQLNESWPLSVEYIVVAVSILIGVLVLLDLEGIKQFSVSIFLLGAMGVFYTVDTFRPFETASFPNIFSLITPIFPQSKVAIQSFVPFTSSFVAFVLQNIGYAVQMVVLRNGAVQMLAGGLGFTIYWPCAGIHSLFIYTFVILLFLKGSAMSLAKKAVCFVVGAVGTFFVNVLRIVSIIDIYVNSGGAAGEYFHNYYGELYFLAWIVVYLFALIFVQRFLTTTLARASASVVLVGAGFGMWFSSGFVSLSLLRSQQLIVSIAGVGCMVAGLILGIHTLLDYFLFNRNSRPFSETT